jgi:hypothetical protein
MAMLGILRLKPRAAVAWQMMAEEGLVLPCPLMDLVGALALTLWPYPHVFRAAKVLVVGKPELRRKFMWAFSNKAMRYQITGTRSAAFVFWALSFLRTCHNKSR